MGRPAIPGSYLLNTYYLRIIDPPLPRVPTAIGSIACVNPPPSTFFFNLAHLLPHEQKLQIP
jgi:hypothetical protein